MAWLFQGVLNAGLQILLSIFGGWLCAYLKLVDPEVLSRQLNAFAMRAAFPAFIIHLLGIKTDLQDLKAWRALGVFILWVFLIHLSCLIWHKLRRGKATVSHLGLNCLLLSTNNTGCIGWPVLIATVGRQGAALSMLLGVLFFIQLLPVTIACFEYQKWLDTHDQHGHELAVPLTAASADGKLPTTSDSTEQPAAGFPHEFRYCYWSMAEYHPQKPHSSSGNVAATVVAQPAYPQSVIYPQYVEVHVDHSEAASDEATEHHCYGNGRNITSSGGSAGSESSSGGSGTRRNTRDSCGKEWWQTGPPKWVYDQQKQQVQQTGRLQPLKRAKDSCDSLCSPFAAAALNSKEVCLQEKPQVVQSPRPVVSSITRRLSRTLTTSALAAAAAPASLLRAASGKKSQSQKEGLCGMTTQLMSSHEGGTSCQTASPDPTAETNRSCTSSPPVSGCQSGSDKDNRDKEAAGMTTVIAPRSTMKPATRSCGKAAADSAVELYGMCDSNSEQELFKHEQQLRQQLAAGADSSRASGNSFLNSAPLSNRVHSRTGLLAPKSGKSVIFTSENSKSKLGSAAAAGAGTADEAMSGRQAVDANRNRFVTFMRNHPLLVHITLVQLKSFHLWLNLVAIALSVSGARKYLDPESPQAIPALGFLDGVLAWFSSACIPVLLFANGVWMCGKDVFGGKKGQLQVTLLLLLKLTILPAVMVGLTLMCGMRDQYGLSLVLLTACPLAPLAFLVCQQYGSGAELATSVTIQGVLLMLPQMMAVIKIAQVAGLYDVELLKAA